MRAEIVFNEHHRAYVVQLWNDDGRPIGFLMTAANEIAFFTSERAAQDAIDATQP